MAFFVFTSCQEEVVELSGIDNDNVITSASKITSLVKRTSFKDGSKDNIIDKSNCISLILPVTVVIQGKEIVLNSEEDFDTVENIFDKTDNDKLSIKFPIKVFSADHTEVTLKNQTELNNLIKDCKEEDDDIECVDFQYPISVSVYDANYQVVETKKLTNDKGLFKFFAQLQKNEFVSFNFPLNLVDFNGNIIVIKDNKQLEKALEVAKNSCDEDDDNDYNDDDFDKETLTSLLKECRMEILSVENPGHSSSEYKGAYFLFNEDKTVNIHIDIVNIPGTWDVSQTGKQTIINFKVEKMSSISGSWLVHKEGKTVVITKSSGKKIVLQKNCEPLDIVDCNDISLNESSLDFSEVKVNTNTTNVVTFTNTSSKERNLYVSVVDSNKNFSLEPVTKLLMPNEELKVNVQFNPKSEGLKQGVLKVEIYKDNMSPISCSFPLKGNVVEEEQILCEDIKLNENNLNFGDVKLDDSLTNKILITNVSSGERSLKVSLNDDLGNFSLDSVEKVLISNEAFEIDVLFSPKTKGTKTGVLKIEMGDVICEYSLTGKGVEPPAPSCDEVTLDASLLNLGEVIVGQTITKDLTITNTASEARYVEVVLNNDNEGNFPVASVPTITPELLSPGQAYTFKVPFEPKTGGEKQTEIHVVVKKDSSASNFSMCPYILKGTAKPETVSLEVLPGSIYFGNVEVGRSKFESIQLRNNGNVDAVITKIEVNNSNFSIPNSPSLISKEQTISLDVNFNPLTNGEEFGILTIYTEDGSTFNASLQGVGITNIVFQDLKFKEALLNQHLNAENRLPIDNNGDGEISYREAEAVTNIIILQANNEITNIGELKHFTNLTDLAINKTNLTSIDISLNTKISKLFVMENELLESLIIGENTNLIQLSVNNNIVLESIDIDNVLNLQTFFFANSNNIKSLDFSNHKDLISFNLINPMNYLSIKNGQNDKLQSVIIDIKINLSNPDGCLEVDNPSATYIDDWNVRETTKDKMTANCN